MTTLDLSGRCAIVTGGNRGIGRGIALALAGAGANICIAARDVAKSHETQAEIQQLGRLCVVTSCDVNDLSDIQHTLAATLSELGGCDILVNNAGIAVANAAEDVSDEQWHQVLNTNLTSVFRFSRAVQAHFARQGHGKIINIGSEYSLFGAPVVSDYAASKGGVIQLTKSHAVAWASQGIQVNAIIPGWIRSDMTASVEADPSMGEPIVARTPAGRFGEPEELGGAAVLLASSAGDFITGQSIVVDGGYSIA